MSIVRSYVEKLGVDAGIQMVYTMIELARSPDRRVVAEGVETAGQLAWLRELGRDLARCYHFSKPLLAGEVEPFLAGPAA